MRYFTLTVILTALFVISLTANPASANCHTKIEAVRAKLDLVPKDNPKRQKLTGMINKAKKIQNDEEKKKKCGKILKKAEKMLKGVLKQAEKGGKGKNGRKGKSGGHKGPMLDGQTTKDALDNETLCAIGRRKCDIKLAIKRGMFETGLRPRFPDGVECLDIDEQWAISYTYKRDRENYHGGIDMPADWGTPMIAAAAGTVIGKYVGTNSYRGKELILRHSPEETGFPLWLYTQYAHFNEMPEVEVGDRVKMGQILGPTGNSGRAGGRRERRPAIHFAVWYSESPQYVALQHKIIPIEGQWMDPNALYRKKIPVDSYSLKDLPEQEKKVPISVMLEDGTTIPTDTKVVWPYFCKRE
jgi:murein DD-endopeptidase MepM/ murein hydrolase activator NlpD